MDSPPTAVAVGLAPPTRAIAAPAKQDATPALPDAPEFLFVQVFGDGTVTPKAGEAGVYDLIMLHRQLHRPGRRHLHRECVPVLATWSRTLSVVSGNEPVALTE